MLGFDAIGKQALGKVPVAEPAPEPKRLIAAKLSGATRIFARLRGGN